MSSAAPIAAIQFSAHDHGLALLDSLAIHRNHVDVHESDERRDVLRSRLRRLRECRRHDREPEQGRDEQVDEVDVESILAVAGRVLPRAADLRVQASLERRQRFQQLFFPERVACDGNRFVRAGVTTGVELLAENRNRK
jgi:hypothetical protein